jgi:hypothetical protein
MANSASEVLGGNKERSLDFARDDNEKRRRGYRHGSQSITLDCAWDDSEK